MLITPQELELHRIVVTKNYDEGTLNYHGAEFRQTGALAVKATAELVGAEIRIRGRFEVRVVAVCDRCLAEVEIPVSRDFDLFYRPLSTIAHEEEVEVSPDEVEVGFYRPEGIELADVLIEQVILAMPMKIVCRPDCQGLCPVCGINRNQQKCQCDTRRSGSPFARLLE